ncbi:hypothetical protein ABZS78_39675, partial [Streptomyces decoyicus]
MAGVFINYRTGDGAVAAVLLDEELKDVFGPENVFRDRRTTPPGVHFPPELWRHLENCAVLLVLIGPNWLSVRDGSVPAGASVSRGTPCVGSDVTLAAATP